MPSKPYDESWLYLIKPLSLRELFSGAMETEELPPNEVMDSRQEVADLQDPHDQLDQPSRYIEIDDVSDGVSCEEEEKAEIAAEADDFSSLPTQ